MDGSGKFDDEYLFREIGRVTNSLLKNLPEALKILPIMRWAFAATISECLSGERPYNEMNLREVIKAVTKKDCHPKIDESWPIELCFILEQCWSKNDSQRPTMKVVILIF